MALTRKFLKALGIEDGVIDEIITAHSETVNALKNEIKDGETLQADLDNLKKENKRLQKQVDENNNTEELEELKKQVEDFKNKEVLDNKKSAYKSMLKEAGIDEKRIGSILKITDFSEIELDEKNVIKGVEDVKKKALEEYKDFVIKTEQQGQTPPPSQNDENNGGNNDRNSEIEKMSMGEYIKFRNEQK